MTTNNLYPSTPAQMADLARRYVPSQFVRGMQNLRGNLALTGDPMLALRSSHDHFSGVVRLAYAAWRDLRGAGLDQSTFSAAVDLVVDAARDFVHQAVEAVNRLAEQVRANLQKQQPQPDPQDENAYQSYASYRWGLISQVLEKTNGNLPAFLQTVTDRKDIRLLRENYPIWYQARHGRAMTPIEYDQVGQWLDRVEEAFMSDRERATRATWLEVDAGLARMQTAAGQALSAVERLRSMPPDVMALPRVFIPFWADQDGERGIWIE